VVTATHQLEIVEDIADRVLVLEAGRIIAAGTSAEILSNTELLLRANLAHAHRHSHGGKVHSHPHFHGHIHSHDDHTHEE
jgi:cobalt/nickel transport system ATP-binding protein